jgi:hypothetical protein
MVEEENIENQNSSVFGENIPNYIAVYTYFLPIDKSILKCGFFQPFCTNFSRFFCPTHCGKRADVILISLLQFFLHLRGNPLKVSN